MPSWAVIGASRGIGLEYVRQLARDPANVVFAIVRSSTTAIHLSSLSGANVHILEADLCDYKTLKLVADKVAKVTGGPIDVLVINGAKTGGEFYFTRLTDYAGTEDEVDAEYIDVFRTNILGPMHAIDAFLPLLRMSQTKKIICISSSAADLDSTLRTGSTMMTAYACSKAALNILVAQYANALKTEGFTCVALSPGIVNTSETTPQKPGESPPGFDAALQLLSRAYPDWTPVAYTPAESVAHQLKTIAALTPTDTGAFLSEKGGTVLYGN